MKPVVALAVVAAVVGWMPGHVAVAAAAEAVVPTAAQQAQLRDCLARLTPQARAAGVSSATYARYTAGLQPAPEILALLDHQPEFDTPIWDYLAGLVDDERVADGRAMLAAHADTLRRVQARYGVDPATVVAVWGVESDYGRTTGKRPLLQSLGTLSCDGRRQSFFRGEFFAALKILQDGDVAADRLTGSWAGAFGQTQFMPSTYRRLAVDFDGDGRRDLVDSVADALASTAHFLQQAGWHSGQAWGFEVRLPDGYTPPVRGRKAKRPLSAWTQDGLRLADGGALPASDTRAGLLLPAGRGGPAFLVLHNFDVIYRYNAAESYTLAIALLSDRLRGGAGLVARWPTDDPGLSRAQRRELQTLLLARGHDIGEVDGMLGKRSRAAIADEQRARGLPANGRAGQKLLQRLRAGTIQPAPSAVPANAIPASTPASSRQPAAPASQPPPALEPTPATAPAP